MKKKRLNYQEFNQLVNTLTDKNRDVSFTYGVNIIDMIFTDQIILIENSTPIHFKNCIFLKGFTFLRCHIISNVYFSHCYFMGDLFITDSSFENQLSLISCKIYNNLIFDSGAIKHLNAYLIFCKKILIGDFNFNNAEFGGSTFGNIDEFNILNAASITKKMQIGNLSIKSLSINSNLMGELELFDCNINSACLNKFRNNGTLKFINVKALPVKGTKSYFTFNQSNIGKAEFFQFEFSSFDEINILNSILNESILVNTMWSDNINSFAGPQMDNFGKDRYSTNGFIWKVLKKTIYNLSGSRSLTINIYNETDEQKINRKDSYRQIKYALSKQGDYINEQFFHGLEMNTYNRTLKFNLKNIWTKSILSLSYIASNYGQSLTRPLLFLIFIGSFLFSFLVLRKEITGVYFVHPNEYTINSIGNTLAEFIRYLNPLHKNDPELKSFSFIIDFILRIVSSYAIYNVIRVTRRFIK